MNRPNSHTEVSNSTAGRPGDGAVPDIHAQRPPRAGFRVGSGSICGDALSKPALGEACSIFIGTPHARFRRLSPRIAP